MPRVPDRASLLCYSLLTLGLALVGCRKEETTNYTVPKESAAPPSAPAAPMAEAGARPLQWTTPAGWTEQPASGMRVGSFAVDKDGQKADVSIIPLGGPGGSELANVNRWRNQIGLEPIDDAVMQKAAEKVTIGETPASLFDFAGTDPKTQQASRILAAMLSSNGTTWFFKMTGPDALVEKEKPTFKDFLKSIRFQGSPGAAPMPAAPMSTANLPPEMQPPPTSAADKPVWQVPTGWQEQAPTSMRLASYAVSGANGAKADVSVIKLGGEGGGMLPNVNRWRGQVGLPPVDEAGLDKLLTSHDVNGSKVTMLDMAGRSVETGQNSRLLVAIVPRGNATWFYKMLGSDQLVEQQKPAFIKFVESARYPND